MVSQLILAARLRDELENLQRIVDVAQRSSLRAEQQPADSELYINSAALSLHSFYVGLERMFQAIAEEVDQKLPSGSSWHLDLINQMTYDLPTLRPAVLTNSTRDSLRDYRSFRHVVRNVYTYNLDAKRVKELVNALPSIFAAIQIDMNRFLVFLDLAGQAPIDSET